MSEMYATESEEYVMGICEKYKSVGIVHMTTLNNPSGRGLEGILKP